MIKIGTISYYEPGGRRVKRRVGPSKRLAEAALKKIKVRKHPKSLYIFCHPNGERVKDIRKSFWTALKKSGIKDFRFHDSQMTDGDSLQSKYMLA